MARFKFTRDFYIPKNSVKVTDKNSDAVAYLYDFPNIKHGKLLYAAIFFGKQSKPVSHYSYRTAQRREDAIRLAFDSRQKSMARKVEQRAERKAWVPDYKTGDLLKTCWGYDQTNVEYFEVTEVKGKHVILREIAQETIQTGPDQGKCVPLPGQYLKPRFEGDDAGEPIRRLAQQGGVKICDVRWASRCKFEMVGGVKVYSPAYYSWGH